MASTDTHITRFLDGERPRLVIGYAEARQLFFATNIPFLELFNMFLEAKKHRTETYLRELAITRDRMPELHSSPVSDLTVRDLGPILSVMPPAARNACTRYLRAVFNYGIKRE